MVSAEYPVIDFTHKTLIHRVNQLRGTNELIAKAIGYRPGITLNVWDTTAGLGVESFLMAALGCEICLFERHPQIADALEAALIKAKTNPVTAPIVARMSLHKGCAIAYLKTHPDSVPDVIYCDPMFEDRQKSAASKKGITSLQDLLGEDKDASELVQLALLQKPKRVVVKRAKAAPTLVRTPTFSLKARSHRFDIYAFVKI